jgi:hypothetical protein
LLLLETPCTALLQCLPTRKRCASARHRHRFRGSSAADSHPDFWTAQRRPLRPYAGLGRTTRVTKLSTVRVGPPTWLFPFSTAQHSEFEVPVLRPRSQDWVLKPPEPLLVRRTHYGRCTDAIAATTSAAAAQQTHTQTFGQRNDVRCVRTRGWDAPRASRNWALFGSGHQRGCFHSVLPNIVSSVPGP